MRRKHNESADVLRQREYGSEQDVEAITGRARRTLQKDRLFGRGFPFYRVHGQILYDLAEVREIVRSGRVETKGGGRAA
jgi:hypothetical protein